MNTKKMKFIPLQTAFDVLKKRHGSAWQGVLAGKMGISVASVYAKAVWGFTKCEAYFLLHHAADGTRSMVKVFSDEDKKIILGK
jgi:hypothetical protein